MTIRDVLNGATAALSTVGFDDPSMEAEFLLGHLLNCSPTQLALMRGEDLNENIRRNFDALIDDRRHRIPAAYLLGEKNFMGLDFFVSRDVLIPRPETELLVEWAVHLLRTRGTSAPTILDVGTGSGCIAIALLNALPQANIIAVDASVVALEIARKNAQRNKCDGKIQFLSSNLFESLEPGFQRHFDMIVSNPPYISRTELRSLAPELAFEPRLALDGGADGLDLLRPLIKNSHLYLKPDGLLLLEIGYDQGDAVVSLFNKSGFVDVELKQDYSGHNRMVSGKRNGSI